jgi:hypothetical protein
VIQRSGQARSFCQYNIYIYIYIAVNNYERIAWPVCSSIKLSRELATLICVEVWP